MEQRLTFITLGVADLETAKDFYVNAFGWTPLPAGDGKIYFFQLNGMTLGLWPAASLAEDAHVPAAGSGFKRFALAYCARSEAEVDRIFADLAAKGTRILKPPQNVFWGGYSGYIADPDDNCWEIAYNPFLKLDEAGNAVA